MRGKRQKEIARAVHGRITPADAGKTLLYLNYEDLQVGSPPRMRGKPDMPCLTFVMLGITPADAGKTQFARFGLPSFGDHPRGCGENALEDKSEAHCLGSPPRMRGKPSATPRCRIQDRITPADAGKTLEGG